MTKWCETQSNNYRNNHHPHSTLNCILWVLLCVGQCFTISRFSFFSNHYQILEQQLDLLRWWYNLPCYNSGIAYIGLLSPFEIGPAHLLIKSILLLSTYKVWIYSPQQHLLMIVLRRRSYIFFLAFLSL